MKKYYCPICKTFKSRWEVEDKGTYYGYGWTSCKYCHHKVIDTETLIQKLIEKTLTDEDLGVEKCPKCYGFGYKHS